MDDEDQEVTEDQLAACSLVVELARSGGALAYIGTVLFERAADLNHSEGPDEGLVLRKFIEAAMPILEPRGAAVCWQAAEVIESIREQTEAEFSLEPESEERRN